MLTGLLSAFICFVFFLAGHVIRFHLPRLEHRLAVMTKIWASLLILYAVLYGLLQRLLPATWISTGEVSSLEGVVCFLNGMLIYLLLFLTYCYCYFISDHSLSVLYMLALEDLPQKRLTLDGLKRMFPYDRLLRQRLDDLEANGFVARSGESYGLTPKGRQRAEAAGALKKFLNLEPGG